ncbi:unnamed protein product [Paramecium octaurelia]|uniref:Uncharacterized protein n=1 Tax=Paramecium octaurelia TaxID=43137 RepID=A0A8S1YLV4_PAROT|nr:unnamed protein product [Paramecium octaurelia]
MAWNQYNSENKNAFSQKFHTIKNKKMQIKIEMQCLNATVGISEISIIPCEQIIQSNVSMSIQSLFMVACQIRILSRKLCNLEFKIIINFQVYSNYKYMLNCILINLVIICFRGECLTCDT